MIEESKGATPYGIYVLGLSYLEAAQTVQGLGGAVAHPCKLLYYHACELLLKAKLKAAGQDFEELRAYQHDLASMLRAACAAGLVVRPQTAAQIEKLTKKNDYVRVRYMVTSVRTDISPASVARIATDIRNAVRDALGVCDEGAEPA